jgi:hypothetical protein
MHSAVASAACAWYKIPMRNLKLFPSIMMLVLLGAGTLTQALGRPRLEGMRTVDIVSLTGSGFCFGIAFAFLLLMVSGRLRPGPGDERK